MKETKRKVNTILMKYAHRYQGVKMTKLELLDILFDIYDEIEVVMND